MMREGRVCVFRCPGQPLACVPRRVTVSVRGWGRMAVSSVRGRTASHTARLLLAKVRLGPTRLGHPARGHYHPRGLVRLGIPEIYAEVLDRRPPWGLVHMDGGGESGSATRVSDQVGGSAILGVFGEDELRLDPDGEKPILLF